MSRTGMPKRRLLGWIRTARYFTSRSRSIRHSLRRGRDSATSSATVIRITTGKQIPWDVGFGIWDLLSSLARLRFECGVGGESFEMRALHERLAEIFGIDDLRDDRQPDVAVRRGHAVVVLGHRRVRAV